MNWVQINLSSVISHLQSRIARVVPLSLLGIAAVACTRCPQDTYGDLKARIPSPETKNDGLDLKGWIYSSIQSTTSDEKHYYYHYPSDDPAKPALVLLHGLLFDGKNFLEFRPLANHFNLYAFDLPNRSSFYRGNNDDFAELLEDFLQSLKLKDIYLGGVSLGGQIAMIYASKPRAVPLDGLVLISTDTAKNERDLKQARRLAKTTARVTDREEDKTLCLVTRLVEKKKKDAKGTLSSLDNFVLRSVQFYNQVLDTSIEQQTPVALKNIRVPTLIVHGDRDSVIDIKDAKQLTQYLPDAAFVSLKGGEHTVAYTHATEITARIVERFFPTR